MSAESQVVPHGFRMWKHFFRPTLRGVSVVGMLVAVLLWLSALDDIVFAEMNDLGLISVLPPAFPFALAVLTLSFMFPLLVDEFFTPLAALKVLVLILFLYGTPAILGEAARFSVTWRHVGVIDVIQRTEVLDPTIDAYFNWPGSFVFGALLSDFVGLDHVAAFGAWASLFFNVLYLGPLIMIARAFTPNVRAQWLSVWLFYSANWVGQDYFSPQALNYFFFLVILAILLTWFRVPSASLRLPDRVPFSRSLKQWLTLPETSNAPSRAGRRAGLVLIVVLLYGVIIISHQLTPFAVLLAVTALVVFNRMSLRGLPLLMAVFLVIWSFFGAAEYMNGHLGKLLDSMGEVGSSVDSNVFERMSGSADHQFVIRMRMVVAFGFWLLAGLGFLRRLWQGHGDVVFILLAGTPFLLMGLQNYGGEILLRIYLFNLPFMALLAAGLFFTKGKVPITKLTLIVLVVVSVALMGGFLVTRYGNERMDYKTQQEVDGVRAVYQVAPEGSLLLSLNTNVAWKFRNYTKYTYVIASKKLDTISAEGIMGLLNNESYDHAYLVITRSQRAYAEMFMDYTTDKQRALEQVLVESGGLKKVYANRDAAIYRRASDVDHEPAHQFAFEKVEPLNVPRTLLLIALLIIPGVAITALLEIHEFWSALTLTLAVGLAAATAVANVLAYLQAWAPVGVLLAITMFSLIVILIKVIKWQVKPRSVAKTRTVAAK